MHFKDLSLRSKLVLGGILIVLIPLILVGTITFINTSRTLADISKVQTVQIATSLSSMVQIAIQKELNFLTATAKDPLIIATADRCDYERLEATLSDLYKKMGTEYEGIAVLDPEGIVRVDAVDKKRVGISVAEREYLQFVRQGKAGIGSVNASKATGRPVFGLAAPIFSSDGRYLGSVLGIVKADFLMKYIQSLKLGQTGYATMLDKQGIVIAHPNQDYILKLDSLNDPGLRENTKSMIRGETASKEYIFKGTKKIIGFAPVDLTGWSVGVIQNKSEVMALAYSNRNLILMVSAFVLLLTVAALLYLSGTVSAPVQKTLATLNQAIQQATEAIFIIGLDKKVQFANPAMSAIIDRPVEEMIGRRPDLQNTDVSQPKKIWETLEAGRLWSGRITGMKKNSTAFTMNLTITPVRDQAGAISCFLAVGKDITRELMMEAQLRQSQKMEAIGTLAGGIAHDFNNILSAVFGYAELALLHLADKEKATHDVGEILTATRRAQELVQRILTSSRQTEQARHPLRPKPIVREALKLLRASLPTTIDIRKNITSDSTILADATEVHQIIVNLCTNARYAMKEQGGVLEVSLHDADVDERFAGHHPGIKAGRHVVLTVSDTGGGIPPTIVERIFDPFFTTKPQGEGTGLGLSVVHGIVKSMGGTLTVASQPGKGTTFTLYLPTSEEATQESDDTAAEDITGGTEKILFIDDEEMLIRSGQEMLEALGYSVTGFTRSDDALEAFLPNPLAFDAVITDYTMPRITGYELAKIIRGVRNDIPIILSSGYMDEDVEMKIKEAGISAFVKKPYIRRDMAAALRRVLDHARTS
jgi:PAS domain S-box-containing protein